MPALRRNRGRNSSHEVLECDKRFEKGEAERLKDGSFVAAASPFGSVVVFIGEEL